MIKPRETGGWPGRARRRRAASFAPRIAMAGLLLAVGAAAGFLAAGHLPSIQPPSIRLPFGHGAPAKKQIDANRVPPGPGTSPSTWQPATGPLTTMVFKTFYTRCGGETTRTEPAGTNLAGLTRAQLTRRFPDWQVDVFRPGQVVLTRVESGPCPDEAWYRTIGVKDGNVVVFAGRSGNRGLVLQDTGIPVDRLLPADRAKLERGVEVQGDAGVWQFLEGLD